MFFWRLMLLWVKGVGFENTYTVLGKWNVSRVIPRLYGWVYKLFITPPLSVELPVPSQGDCQSVSCQSVVITAGTQSGGAWVRILWVANFWLLFYEISAQNQWEQSLFFQGALVVRGLFEGSWGWAESHI